ncbi:hypothetical protein FGU71_04650 [Erythrobacter insulae]|uniref:Pectate lyase superfamily protein domain-containing protein n=1 Tax=Erythrobacter insulae TaxID=2584124 RepID=A0A547PAQ6_9SPHN|nr:hypothetical protein [Erythrobacter insulae]TRD11210.1 hypothetical protein FGU71_04650 [Erythrobacter insulae]
MGWNVDIELDAKPVHNFFPKIPRQVANYVWEATIEDGRMMKIAGLTALGIALFSIASDVDSIKQFNTAPTNSVEAPEPALISQSRFEYGREIDKRANAPLVSLNDETGKLQYALYANHSQTNADHMVPDFSYAGYGGGGVALPSYDSVEAKQTLSPVTGDNHASIQAAINKVAALPKDGRGIRGAVLLQAGEYQISDTLEITASGVILRGSGQGKHGTVLIATTNTPQSTLVTVRGEGSGRLPQRAARSLQTDIVQGYVPVGTISIEVADASGYRTGDAIAIVRTPNAAWVGKEGIDTAQFGWTADSYALATERTVTSVSGNTIAFDAPVTDTIEEQFGGGYVYRTDTSKRLQQVGIENLRLQTLDYTDVTREDRAFFAIAFWEVENSWVRDVTSRFFSRAFNFYDGSRFNTMQDLAFIDPDFEVVGGQHYAFDFNDAGQNFFQRCYSRDGRHSFTSGSRATGPNVFLDCLAENSTNDSGPHHRWATGTLYDNVRDSLLRVQNRANSGGGHGWTGAQQMLWNSALEQYVLQAPPRAMNWAIGIKGDRIRGRFSPHERDGIIQSPGSYVTVRSLYLRQLEDRLGPQAVVNITVASQLSGRIWDELSAWRGEGKFHP